MYRNLRVVIAAAVAGSRGFWSFAFVVALGCGLFACSRKPAPSAAAEARTQSAVAATPALSPHNGAAGADHGSWATDGNSIPEALRESCAKVNSLVRSVAGSAPKSTKITQLIGPRAITFKYLYATARWAGCEFVVRGSDAVSSTSLFEAIEKAFDEAGWMPMGAMYSADAPDARTLVTHTMAACAWLKGGGTAMIATPRFCRGLSSMFSLRARRCAPTISRPLNGAARARSSNVYKPVEQRPFNGCESINRLVPHGFRPICMIRKQI